MKVVNTEQLEVVDAVNPRGTTSFILTTHCAVSEFSVLGEPGAVPRCRLEKPAPAVRQKESSTHAISYSTSDSQSESFDLHSGGRPTKF
jgi:hypothetical protein